MAYRRIIAVDYGMCASDPGMQTDAAFNLLIETSARLDEGETDPLSSQTVTCSRTPYFHDAYRPR
jgi:hypothetical protein